MTTTTAIADHLAITAAIVAAYLDDAATTLTAPLAASYRDVYLTRAEALRNIAAGNASTADMVGLYRHIDTFAREQERHNPAGLQGDEARLAADERMVADLLVQILATRGALAPDAFPTL